VILDFKDDTQFGFPTWSPDGSQLAFFMYRHGQQDVWICDNDGANLRPLTYDRFDDRDTSWSPDGQHVVFSSDRNGVFNIYQVNVKTGKVTQLTDVISGAFMPHIKSDGSSLTYSYYTSYGYRPYELPTSSWLNRSVDEFQMDVTPAEIQANLTTTVPIPEIKGRDYSVFDGFGSLIPINKNHAGTWVWIPFVSYEDARLQVGAQFVMSDAVDKNNITAYVYVGEEQRYSVFYENYMLPVTTFLSLHRIFPATATDFEVFDFNVNANFDASFYFVGLRWQDWSLSYNYQDIRVEQPNIRTRQFTSRSYELSVNKSTVPGNIDSGINPRGGHALYARVEYGSPNLHEPFTGAPMGGDVADFFGDPAVITLEEARHYPDENYLLTDYGFTKFEVNYRNYIPFPFWDLSDLNDTLPIKGWDWENLNFERWKRARHTLALKARVGYVHSTIPEGFGYGNSFGRVNFYDRFTGGGLFVSGLGVFSDNGAFLGYENYSLSGETVAVFGYDYRFPLIREIDKEVWAFYFDKLYFSFFGNTGNFWSHVSRKKDMFNADKVFDKSGDGKFNPNDDLISDAGIELRLSSYLFMSNWDSFIKVAHGFQDKENDERDIPLRFYIGLGTGFDD
ncbi:PD40 domain-containing protein, partial [bacterium]|nr:PD40 domain-containing protein [bacterium]